MAGKKFVIDFDIDDRNYRSKLEKLMSEASRMADKTTGSKGFKNLGSSDNQSFQRMRMQEQERNFRQQYSQSQIDLSKRRVESGPFSGMASKEDHKIVEQSAHFDRFNKVMSESTKQSKMAQYETRNRHREYRSLSTRQLETDIRKMRRSATKDEKSKHFDRADEKRKDISAMEGIVNQRKGNEGADPGTRAMNNFTKHFLMQNALKGIGSVEKGGKYVAGGLSSGVSTFGASKAAGFSDGASSITAIIASLVEPILEGLGTANQTNKNTMRMGSSVGQGGEIRQIDAWNESWEGGMESKFKNNLGGDMEQTSAKMKDYAKSGNYGGTSVHGIMDKVYEEDIVERTLGVDTQTQQQYDKAGGRYGDRQEGAGATLGYANFLQQQKAGDIKVGIDDEGNVGDRNLSRLPDYMKRLIEINEAMFKVTGERSEEQQDSAMKFMGSIISQGGIFANEDVAAESAQGIRDSFASPGDALHEYKNIRAYREATGDTSAVGMKEAMENMDDPRVVNQRNKDLAAEYGMEGKAVGEAGNYREAEFIENYQKINKIESFTKARTSWNQRVENGGLDENVEIDTRHADMNRLGVASNELTTTAEVASANTSAVVEGMSKGILDGISDFTSAMGDFGNNITQFNKGMMTFASSIGTWSDFGGAFVDLVTLQTNDKYDDEGDPDITYDGTAGH